MAFPHCQQPKTRRSRKRGYPIAAEPFPEERIPALAKAISAWLDGEIEAGRWEAIDHGSYLEVRPRKEAA